MENFEIDFYKTISIGAVLLVGWFLRSIYKRFSDFMANTSKAINENAKTASDSFKEVTQSINTLNVSVEKLILKYDHSYELIKRNEQSIADIQHETQKSRDRLHKLEGSNSQILEFMKEGNQ